MLPSEQYLNQLEDIKESIIRNILSIEGVNFVFWKTLWNIQEVGPRWFIQVRLLSLEDNLDMNLLNSQELLLSNESGDSARLSFASSKAEYDSYENMCWNFMNAGFVEINSRSLKSENLNLKDQVD